MTQKRLLPRGTVTTQHIVQARFYLFLCALLIAWVLCMAAVIAAAPNAIAQTPATYAPCINSAIQPSGPTTVFISSIGSNGGNGGSSSFEGPGHAGQPGSPGSALSYAVIPFSSPVNSVSLFSLGGNGGEGSNAGNGDPGGSNGGGEGTVGGAGGAVGIATYVPIALPASSLLISAVCAYSAGGNGGQAGISQDMGPKHASGAGGMAGGVTLTIANAIMSEQASGVIAESQGGNGNDGKSVPPGFTYAGDAGAGANGGAVTVANSGTINSTFTGITAESLGGNGGKGGAGGTVTNPGSGGNGGLGGSVSVTNTGNISTGTDGSSGINAYSYGGVGGDGGSGGGNGGVGGAGGTVAVIVGESRQATISTPGNAPGVLAQSIGGQGAPGSDGAFGGAGGSGGDGGTVILEGSGAITTGSVASPQNNSQGILAQSIGGGGGNGGDAHFTFVTLGGKGGVASNGGPITVNLGTQITTFGTRSQGIVAQSIGGGGGNAGDATGLAKLYNLVIGGTGGGGGNGGPIIAYFDWRDQTNGAQSPGMLLQSIGGGGGSGGAAVSTVKLQISGQFKIGVGVGLALGGAGSGGGNGGSISQFGAGTSTPTPTNVGVISTIGPDSTGILAQSIGGGGGKGGSAASSITQTVGAVDWAYTYAVGGAGGGGGNGGDSTLQNSGMILTVGAGSRGLHAQSVGGGGGDGGDATSGKFTSADSLSIVDQFNIGGMSGGGGQGGSTTLTNSGLIMTTGADADALLAQSIGGGGGSSTGTGDAISGQDVTVSGTLGSSIQLGSSIVPAGGNGAAVTLINNDFSTNIGSIVTLGDGAAGMLAQSIGGGGGRMGGGAGGSGNASFSMTATLGASAGGGSSIAPNGATIVNVTNNGAILTFGADAPGILAQSIGGGGGVYGKGASTLGFAKSTGDGGNGIDTAGPVMASVAFGGVEGLVDYTSISNLLHIANLLVGAQPDSVSTDPFSTQLADLAASNGTSSNVGTASSLNINLALGASGNGQSWDGGNVQVTNSGQIGTAGRMSLGVLAQSIGGGGGVAGATNTALASNSSTANIALGGFFSNGDAGSVGVTNTATSGVFTTGSVAPGIVAQSIGGGGGLASLSAGSAAAMNSLTVVLGGAGSDPVGNGGNVTVNNAGGISTMSHDAPGIIAQSIGGGGGLVRLLANDLETASGSVPVNHDFTYNLNLGANSCQECGTGGSAGPVTITHAGVITTQGNNAYGILAQSIGGGGGAVLGGTPSASGLATSPTVGNGGSVTITMGNSSGTTNAIYTTGQGSAAIVAQSIGGGGGLAGDFGLTTQLLAFPSATQSSGNGGAITITDYYGGELVTTGNNAPVIFAQSIGGGGGRIVNSSGAYDGTFGGSGTGGPVTIYISGDVAAGGVSSPGIFAESSGSQSTTNGVNITVYSGGLVSGGIDSKPGAGDGAGIYIVNTGTGSQENSITIRQGGTVTSQNGPSGTAIFATGTGATLVENGGTISGAVILNAGNCIASVINGCDTFVTQADPAVGSFTNMPSGLLRSNLVNLGGGTLTNAGTFDVRAGGTGTATLAGNYHQVSGGVLQVGADFAKGTADHLTITGNAQLDPGSTVRVDVADYNKGSVPVVTVNGTLTDAGASAQASNPSYLFGLKTAQSGNTLQVQTMSNLRTIAPGLSPTQQSVADSLDQIWNSGSRGFDVATAALATVNGDGAYRAGLRSIAGTSIGGIVATRQATSERFTENLINCQNAQNPPVLGEGSCGWMRILGGRVSLANSGGDPGYQQNSITYQIGGQTEVAPGWFVGASLGYESSWLQGDDDNTNVAGQTVLLGAMLKRQSGPWHLSGVVDGGYGWYQSARQINVGNVSGGATGSPDVTHAGLHLKAAYEVGLGDWYIKPSMSAEAIYRHISAYAESGSTLFNLDGQASSDVMGGFSPMVEAGRSGSVDGFGTLRAFAGVGAAFYVNNNWAGSANFQAAPGTQAFTATSRLPSAVARLSAGLDLFTDKNFQGKLVYDASLAPGYTAQTLMARVSYAF